jgi:hypothetical protein
MKKSVVIACCLLAAAFAQAQNSFSVLGSYWSTSDADSGLGGLVRGQFVVAPTETGSLSVMGQAGYFSGFGDDDYDVDMTVVPVEAGLMYSIPIVPDDMYFYVGAGAGVYMTDFDTDYIDVEADPAMGFFLLGGLSKNIGPQMRLFGEVKFTSLEVDADVEWTETRSYYYGYYYRIETRRYEGEKEIDLSGIGFNVGLEFLF